ncbi:MAG TPA: class I SAM-dependent methyltransferase [Acidimicrobiales bacterium]
MQPGLATVADVVAPVIRAFIGADPPFAFRFWDGSEVGPGTAAATGAATVVVHGPEAIRRILFAPNELGLGRAYVAGELDIEGDVYAALDLRAYVAARDQRARVALDVRGWGEVVRAARRLGILGLPLRPPPEEARLHGRRHSKERDAAAVAHHYDAGNDFYRLVLGPTLTYSCAYFASEDQPLDDAQEHKHDLVCRKLGLRPGMRLLDVGCGWGTMVLHAATHHDVHAVGVTLSRQQADLAAARVADAGLTGRVQIRYQDYRDIADGPYDAISSIGMFEHVGAARLSEYFQQLFTLLRPHGRLLNHAISRPPGDAHPDRHSFIERYVFPDGELQEVGALVSGMQANGFEVRDVQSLREHYALTLRHWVANLDADWEKAQQFAGPARARVWRLYMAASALNFEAGRANLHQVLGVKVDDAGGSGVPLTRHELMQGAVSVR